ncbi:hypothetical protein HQ393_12740 [Chitinibacter bivalviorum]|uniref:PEP-CTERM sorting domain-containing protein n=1 Tax=Chitinibacter bivalviorum TaxID=2739434 RepID=A0A7H9BK27_9NEIS|nr:hypothetical protein [Chitinibacter bivalviorum]QLG89035.1 hypothetical protein HQ393_12740 [Chitinibacter bivalviorum]
MNYSAFVVSLLLVTGAAQAEVIKVQDNLFAHHNFQKLSATDGNHLAMLNPPVSHKANSSQPKFNLADPEVFGLIGVGMVGLVARRRKRLF